MNHSFAFNSNLISHLNNTIISDFKLNEKEKKDNLDINNLYKLLDEKLDKVNQTENKESMSYFNQLSNVILIIILDI